MTVAPGSGSPFIRSACPVRAVPCGDTSEGSAAHGLGARRLFHPSGPPVGAHPSGSAGPAVAVAERGAAAPAAGAGAVDGVAAAAEPPTFDWSNGAPVGAAGPALELVRVTVIWPVASCWGS